VNGGRGGRIRAVIAVSGGPDSVYLLRRTLLSNGDVLIAHVNHGARGRESDEDTRFVEEMGGRLGLPVRIKRLRGKQKSPISGPGFEEKARKARYEFLRASKKECRAEHILLAHTADDQVETVLMRILEGAGISGLKGIPRKTADGIERPLLDTWREDILKYLHQHKIPYRVDKSNFDTRFERNWVRHVLIPLLEKRYGKAVKKRIFALGERFREIDEYLESAARRWMKRNVAGGDGGKQGSAREAAVATGQAQFQRGPFGKLPSALRKKILQLICFERIGIAPNERLLESLDRLLVSGGPSARLNIGKGALLRCRYGRAVLEIDKRPETDPTGGSAGIVWEERGRIAPAGLKRLAMGERAAAFDADAVQLPLGIRTLEAGDRIHPFGLVAEKKVKEVLIDRKVPREERWGRPVVCDAEGRILWVPGVVRSALAPVTGKTRRAMVFRLLEVDSKGGA